MWTQIVGKIALASGPPLNHCWGPRCRSRRAAWPRGVLAHRARSFTLEFDLVSHRLILETSDGEHGTLPLGPQSVADFYRATMSLLERMELPVKIWPMPVEIPAPIRFDQDTRHDAYDPADANGFWRTLS